MPHPPPQIGAKAREQAQGPSVFDSPLEKAIKWLAGLAGLDDPASQVLALMNPAVPAGMETAGPLVKAVQMLAGKGKQAIKAYHGSPHDFDQFSTAKIGTGEGAQAYGHGLYFAENEATAKQYRDMLSGKTRGGAVVYWDDPAEVAAMRLSQFGGDKDAAIKWVAERRPNPSVSSANARAAQFTDDIIAAINEGRTASQVDKGRMYEVAIHADPETFLDWDAPLGQQSEQVRKALDESGLSKQYGMNPHLSGERFVRTLEDNIPLKDVPRVKATERLRDAGVPGIKYLDQGSRAAGEGSRNYVVFDDSLVSILRKYGVALPMIEALRQRAQGNGGQVSTADVSGAMR